MLQQLDTLKSTSTRNQFYSQEWLTDQLTQHQSIETLLDLMEESFEDTLSSYLVDFPARTYQSQDAEKVWMESEVDFSLKSADSSKKFNQYSSSLKMFLQSGQEDLMLYSKNLPRSGMIVDGQLFQPAQLEPVTKGIDGSCLPTPTACVYGSNTSPNSTNKRLGLMQLAQKGMLPTPTARDWKDSGAPSEMERNSPSLAALAGGSLNPLLVEELMGYNLGWSDLGALVTPLYRFKQKRLLKD
jgi:hypothetical protein